MPSPNLPPVKFQPEKKEATKLTSHIPTCNALVLRKTSWLSEKASTVQIAPVGIRKSPPDDELNLSLV